MKEKTIKLTDIEIRYLLSLADINKEEGVFWGRHDYFIVRQNKVIKKLEQAIKGIK